MYSDFPTQSCQIFRSVSPISKSAKNFQKPIRNFQNSIELTTTKPFVQKFRQTFKKLKFLCLLSFSHFCCSSNSQVLFFLLTFFAEKNIVYHFFSLPSAKIKKKWNWIFGRKLVFGRKNSLLLFFSGNHVLLLLLLLLLLVLLLLLLLLLLLHLTRDEKKLLFLFSHNSFHSVAKFFKPHSAQIHSVLKFSHSGKWLFLLRNFAWY